MPLKIVHLTSVHPPFDSRIFHKECRTLAEAGHTVVLVVPHDSAEAKDGVRIHPIPKSAGRLRRMTRTVRAVYRAAVKEDGDVYHIHDPELLVVAAALRLRGKHTVYDVHEDLPRQIHGKHWIPRWLWSPISFLAEIGERTAAAWCTRIVAATPTIGGRFPARKTVVVQNFPMLEEWSSVESPSSYSTRPANLVYIGGITALRGAHQMVEAMERLPATGGAVLQLAGTFSPSALEQELSKRPGWERVRYLGWQSRQSLNELLGKARIGLVVLHPRRSYLDSFPIKLFEYMAAGLPVVASDFPLWREIVDDAGCGLLADPLDSGAIAAAAGWLLAHPDEAATMGRNGRVAIEKKYNWQHEGGKLLAMYASMDVSRRS